MNPEGVGRLFTATYKSGAVGVPTESLSPVPIRGAGMTVDGPMPEFYEPIESPTANLCIPRCRTILVPKLSLKSLANQMHILCPYHLWGCRALLCRGDYPQHSLAE